MLDLTQELSLMWEGFWFCCGWAIAQAIGGLVVNAVKRWFKENSHG
jgi:hypothetical protein